MSTFVTWFYVYRLFFVCSRLSIKPWPNEVASYLKSDENLHLTWVSVWPWLAITCDDLRSLWSSSNLHASKWRFSPFAATQSRQVVASWLQYCFSLYGHAYKAALKLLFCYLRWTCVYMRVLFTTLIAKVHIFELVLTCDSVWPGLRKMLHSMLMKNTL